MGQQRRFIGVDKAILNRLPDAANTAMRGYHGFALWRTLPPETTQVTAGHIVRQQCVRDWQPRYAFVVYLTSLEYLMVGGQAQHAKGSLKHVLGHRDFRFAPGAFHNRTSTASSFCRHLSPLRAALRTQMKVAGHDIGLC